MCGRFSLFSSESDLQERFQIENFADIDWTARYNIAPSQNVIAMIQDEGGNRAGFLRWGLVPSWAKNPKIGYKMINARAETVDEKPSFRNLLIRRRCLIIADGFYEWKKEGKIKQPYRFQFKAKEPFAFAGLWDRWENDGEVIHSCTIITTEANTLVKSVHDRMPVILTRDAEKIWLDRSVQNKNELKSLLIPFDRSKMEAFPVSTLVNSPRNDSEEIVTAL